MFKYVITRAVVATDTLLLTVRPPVSRQSRLSRQGSSYLSESFTVFCRHSRDGLSTVENSRLSRHCRRQSVDNSSSDNKCHQILRLHPLEITDVLSLI